ncbi:hypothetical protein L1049_023981 [Liquidambar formosana]|uniref:Phosphatidic acid phosphatase type 2/haloperoxidase domain-containing protein n=1 Tax=Liquidambar formosana TaxID=63359 RepID=A0AAP0RVC1_LIQFO
MLAQTVNFHLPTPIFFPTFSSKRKSLKPFSFPNLPSSKSVFFGGFVSKRTVSEENRIWGPNTMTELIETSAFRSSDGDRALEQEVLVNGSPEFVAHGFESTLNRLSKWLVAALFGVVILWRHDAEALWAAMGSVVNAGLSITLKRILNQERPVPTAGYDPGMPSSHAQSIFFTVMFIIISMTEWFGINELTLTISALVSAFGSYLAWLRVSQQLHTISQVVVGAIVGSIFSILWFWSWKAVVLQAFISFLWVRIFVVLGAAGFCLWFLLYVIRYWLMDER